MRTEQKTDRRLLLLSPDDNVLVLGGPIKAGEPILISGVGVTVKAPVSLGHKLAAKAIATGSKVIKYGAPIGSATQDIAIGDHVHIHNMKSDYTPTYALDDATAEGNDA